MSTLFDIDEPDEQTHACSGSSCRVCELDERKGRSRRNDHKTSKAGAQDVAYRAGSQKDKLLNAYRTAYPAGLTDEEAAIAAGLSLRSCFWKRCSELRQDRLIVRTGESREGSANVEMMVCRYVMVP